MICPLHADERLRRTHVSGRAQQQSVEQAEHRRVRADAEREGRDHGCGEEWCAATLPQGVTEIVRECVEAIVHGEYPVAVSGRGDQFGAAGVEGTEASERLLFGLAARHAARDEIVDAIGEMRANLVVRFALDAAMLAHENDSTALTVDANRFHFSAS